MCVLHRVAASWVVVVVAGCAAPERPITENQEPLAVLALPEDARAGEPARFTWEGTRDLDGAIASIAFEAGDGAPPLALAASASEAVHVFETPGLYTVALVVTDDEGLAGRARKPLLVLPADASAPPDTPPETPPETPPDDVIDEAADDDADGLINAEDPAPALFNGLRLEMFAIDSIPRDLLARQKAEDVLSSLESAEALAVVDVTEGWSARAASEDALSDVYEGGPARAEQFALRFTGTLTPPVGAAALEVELGADDLCVVRVDGAPIASADEEYALDFLRNDRVPSSSGPLELFGPVDLEIVLANDGGPYAWDVTFRFLDADGAVMDGAPTQGSFLLP